MCGSCSSKESLAFASPLGMTISNRKCYRSTFTWLRLWCLSSVWVRQAKGTRVLGVRCQPGSCSASLMSCSSQYFCVCVAVASWSLCSMSALCLISATAVSWFCLVVILDSSTARSAPSALLNMSLETALLCTRNRRHLLSYFHCSHSDWQMGDVQVVFKYKGMVRIFMLTIF